MKGSKMKRCIIAFVLLALMASSSFAGPLDTLKTTWERAMATMTEENRNNPGWTGTPNGSIWTRMERPGPTAAPHAIHVSENGDSEVLPFVKIVANNSGGRVRYETMGYSNLGVPIPLLIVGYPKAPKGPEEVGDRIVVRWQCSIHGGENDGTEASLIFLREAAQGKHDAILKDAVVLVTPTVNPDGKNVQTRANAQGYDLNRVWSAVNAPEVTAALRLYRKWDPYIVLDHHNAGLTHRHVVTYANGKWGNNDPETDFANARYAESVFGDGPGKHVDPVTNFYKVHLRKIIADYSIGNALGNAPVALSNALDPNTGQTSPTRNSAISLVAMPYMEAQPTALVSRDGQSVREIVTMPNPISDSTRSSSTLPVSKNRFAILMEIYSSPHTLLKVQAMYAAGISAIEQAVKQKSEIMAFIKGKDEQYINLNNSSPEDLTTVYQGGIDYRPTGANGGNAGEPWRKLHQTNHDIGWGPGIFKLEAFAYNGTAVDRTRDYTHYPELILNNLPQYPIKMGAFYIMDPRADKAAQVLLMQNVEVYKLKEDVQLPNNVTFKFYGPGGAESWGITKNTSVYEGIYTTKVPRTRVEIISNFGVPLTGNQIPSEDYAPTDGGGDWMAAPANYVAKAGYYVIPTAQRFARYVGFQLEPRSNCGLLFWGHWDSAVGGDGRYAPANFNLDLVKTFDYTAIPASALERLYYAEDIIVKPTDAFAPPYLDLNGNFSSLTDAGATIDFAVLEEVSGKVVVSIKDACLHDGQWLTFFFYDENGNRFDVVAQVFESGPGTVQVVFENKELLDAGLVTGKKYFIHYSNEYGDIYGYGTLTKGGLAFGKTKQDEKPDPDPHGCNAGFAALAFLAVASLFIARKK